MTFEEAFQVSLGRNARPIPPERTVWRRKREQQIDWMAEMRRRYGAPQNWPPMPDEYRTTVDDVRKAFDIR